MQRVAFALLAVLALLCLYGCDMMLAEALSPKSGIVKAPGNDNGTVSESNLGRVFVQVLEDRRPDKEITRVKSGLLQLPLSVETPDEVPAFLTRALKTRLSEGGLSIDEDYNPGVCKIYGEILTYNLDFSMVWVARVDMSLTLESGNTTRTYRLKKIVEKWNWLGIKSGVSALDEALQKALDQLPVEQLTQLAQ